MRFLDDSGQFGLLVSPHSGHRLFRFQFIVGGQLVGDNDGCILGSVMTQLKDRPHVDDERLDLLGTDPAKFMEMMAVDEFLHDSTIMSSVESLDRWTVYSYVRLGRFVIVAQEVSSQGFNPIFIANVDEVDFLAIVDAARTYWLNCQ
ncbi:hypothetical protein OG992_23840 [Micromonospora sp. NBC_00362]|uniref:hypothetical protein n=1 Tax=Micromonospora sp. NBC_00362 TaxID=2975975 RepID=UPI00225750F6|nr:hypothetical protein [Micromonospora sp. NBC_00362]MCX5120220.1 hypothetical protein [Micromonospora sp. NBC_00362]